MKTQITVTRALVELKRIAQRINSEISSGTYVAVLKGKGQNAKVVGSIGTASQVEANIQSSLDSVEKLIANRQALKAAIVESNANTNVTLGGKSMSVAEAIELKSSVVYKQTLLSKLQVELHRARQTVETGNAALEKTINDSLDKMFGSEKSKVEGAYDLVATPQKNVNELSVFDPKKIEDKIKVLQTEINLIDTELDFTLSEINAQTLIEVDM